MRFLMLVRILGKKAAGEDMDSDNREKPSKPDAILTPDASASCIRENIFVSQFADFRLFSLISASLADNTPPSSQAARVTPRGPP